MIERPRFLPSGEHRPVPACRVKRCERWFALALTCSAGALPAGGADSPDPLAPMQVAFSQRMFAEVNENDARAAMIVWADTLSHERSIPVQLNSNFLAGANVIASALRGGTVDAITLPVDEYWALGDDAPPGPFIVGVIAGRVDEEYVLVVRKDRGFSTLAQLAGQRLGIYHNPRASLAPIWLETLLLQENAGRIPEFFGHVTGSNKLARVVLPVFFGQSDAALITREGHRLMSELNPQVGEQLVALAESAAFLPVVFCFRRDYTSPLRDKLRNAINRVHETPAGLQTLTLFQAERLVECSLADLDSARTLLDLHQRLTGRDAPAANVSLSPVRAPSR